MSHREDVQKLLSYTQRRLQKLKETKAQYGAATAPEIEIEIEDMEAIVARLKNELTETKRLEEKIELLQQELQNQGAKGGGPPSSESWWKNLWVFGLVVVISFLSGIFIGMFFFIPSDRESENTEILAPTFYADSGWVHFQNGNYDLALIGFNEALKIDPNLADVYDGLGWVHYKQQNYEDALLAFDQAIQLEEELADAYDGRGWTYYRMGESDLAIADFNQATRIKPDFLDAFVGLGWAFNATEKYDLAIATFNKAIALDSDHKEPELYNGLGWAFLRKGEYEPAIQNFEKALSISPQLEDANEGLQQAIEEQNGN